MGCDWAGVCRPVRHPTFTPPFSPFPLFQLHLSYSSSLRFGGAPQSLKPIDETLAQRDKLLRPRMDTSNPAVFVNGELLRLYLGKKVRTVVQVIRSESGVVHGRSPDDQQLIVKGSPPGSLSQFVEVIGTAESAQSIHTQKWNNFGEAFDLSNFNQLCKLANGEFKHLFL